MARSSPANLVTFTFASQNLATGPARPRLEDSVDLHGVAGCCDRLNRWHHRIFFDAVT